MSCEHKGGDWSDALTGIARSHWKLGERGMKQILPQSLQKEGHLKTYGFQTSRIVRINSVVLNHSVCGDLLGHL